MEANHRVHLWNPGKLRTYQVVKTPDFFPWTVSTGFEKGCLFSQELLPERFTHKTDPWDDFVYAWKPIKIQPFVPWNRHGIESPRVAGRVARCPKQQLGSHCKSLTKLKQPCRVWKDYKSGNVKKLQILHPRGCRCIKKRLSNVDRKNASWKPPKFLDSRGCCGGCPGTRADGSVAKSEVCWISPHNPHLGSTPPDVVVVVDAYQ